MKTAQQQPNNKKVTPDQILKCTKCGSIYDFELSNSLDFCEDCQADFYALELEGQFDYLMAKEEA